MNYRDDISELSESNYDWSKDIPKIQMEKHCRYLQEQKKQYEIALENIKKELRTSCHLFGSKKKSNKKSNKKSKNKSNKKSNKKSKNKSHNVIK